MTKHKIGHRNEHVVPRDSKNPTKVGWAVRREGSEKVSKLFDTQHEAMIYAGGIAKRDNAVMVVHKHNGEFKNFRHAYEIHIVVKKVEPKMKICSPIFEQVGEVSVISFNNTEEPIITLNAA